MPVCLSVCLSVCLQAINQSNSGLITHAYSQSVSQSIYKEVTADVCDIYLLINWLIYLLTHPLIHFKPYWGNDPYQSWVKKRVACLQEKIPG